MKVGLVIESGPQGAEAQVLPYLAHRIVDGLACFPLVTFNSKPDMLANCGHAVDNLFKDGCDKVLIIWDLYPAWREKGAKPSCVEDCNLIESALSAAGISRSDGRTVLICIREELEGWLLADGRALSRVLSNPTRNARIRDRKRPDQIAKPKGTLKSVFRQNGGVDYVDRIHAVKIVEALPDLNRIRRSQSFQRFFDKLRG